MMNLLKKQSTRAYLYRVLAGGLGVIAGYDLIADSSIPLWAGLGAALLGLGVAVNNTSTKPDSE